MNGVIHGNQTLILDQPSATAAAAWLRGPAGQEANLIIQGGNLQAWWITGANGVLRIGETVLLQKVEELTCISSIRINSSRTKTIK